MAQRDESDRLSPTPPPARKPGKPKITDEMRANARANPNSWLYVIDEAFDPNGAVPSWAVVGAYPACQLDLAVVLVRPEIRHGREARVRRWTGERAPGVNRWRSDFVVVVAARLPCSAFRPPP